MAYCTQDDILELISEAELIELTQDVTVRTWIETSRVDRAIADADEEINGYCAKGYSVPFSTVPDLIRKLSVDIAIYNLYSRRDTIPELRERRYKSAVKLLENVSKGTVTLGVVPAPEENPDQAAAKSTKDRVFSRETMNDW